MSTKSLTLILLIIVPFCFCQAQTDSILQQLQNIPNRYINTVEKKVTKYSHRITDKTEKTLVKLSRWEKKIQSLLQKVNPEAANKLFAPGQTTFTTVLQKYREGKTITEGYKARYDKYTDDLATQFKYLEDKKELLDKKYLQPLADSKKKMNELEKDMDNTEAMQQFIKERKKQLIQEAVKYIGKSKYLTKIDKESYYYVETLRNYKEIFSDKKKTEEVALKILNKIPAFAKFIQENSMLAQLFGSPSNSGSIANLSGLQTRASVNSLIQNQITSGGPNAQQVMQQNFQQAQAELSKLKDKVMQKVGSSGDMEIPNFIPNQQRKKIFLQRLEFGTNLQTAKSNGYFPSITDLGLSVGYKINDKSIIGVGFSYKLGLGKDISHIKFSSEGAGLRNYVDYKLKKSFWLSGGAEMNYLNRFNSITALQRFDAWQTSALLGLTKKISVGKKLKGKIQLMYDFLYLNKLPANQPFVFRSGYSF